MEKMRTATAQELIASGESLRIELKRELSQRRPQDICKEIAALATAQGGDLFVGVSDERAVIGVINPAEIVAKLENWVAAYVSPVPAVTFEVLTIEGHSVVHVHIAEGLAPLYYYAGRPYLRVGSISTIASPDQAEYLISSGKMLSEMRANVAAMAGLETKLHPARHTAAAIMGQGELATKNYDYVRSRLFKELAQLLLAAIDERRR